MVEADAQRQAPHRSAACSSISPLLILGRCIGCMALVSTSTSKPRAERVLHHGQDLRVHERLAAGEADLARAEPPARDLVEVGAASAARDVGEAIVARGSNSM